MSQENVEIVRRVSDAYNRRDVEAMLDELHPEIEWHPWLQIQIGGAATVIGGTKASARESETGRAFSEIQSEPVESGTLASESSPSVTSADAAMRAAQ